MSSKKNYRALVLLDGSDPLAVFGRDEIERYAYSVAADGALNRCLIAGIKPTAVVGDFDSVNLELLQAFKEDGGIVDSRQDQDSTDFEKSLNHLIEVGVMGVDIIGYHGDRFDHMLAMLDVAIRYSTRLNIKFFDTKAVSWIINESGQSTIENMDNHTCSLIPLLPCKGVILSGFKWELDKEHLEFGSRVSCSNVIKKDLAVVSLKEGSLLVYLHNEAIED